MNETFICRACKQDLPRDQMAKHLNANKGKGACRPCFATYINQRMLTKKAEILPSSYIRCNDCKKVATKYLSGARINWDQVERKEREFCGYCESWNIDEFKRGLK